MEVGDGTKNTKLGEPEDEAGSDNWYLANNSCGQELLAGIDGLTFQGVEASATGCGFYMQQRQAISWRNNAKGGVRWGISIARKLLEFGLVQVTAGDTLQIFVGVNIFDSYDDMNRSQHS